MASSSNSKTITLKSDDGKEFVVSEMVAMQFQTLRQMIEEKGAKNTIPVPDVKASILAKVIDYCTMHLDAADASETETTDEGSSTKPGSSKITDEELKKWDQEFLNVDQATLLDLFHAGNDLNISTLVSAVGKKAANMMMGKSVEEIRRIFNITSDFTAEQEEEIRGEHPWAFQ